MRKDDEDMRMMKMMMRMMRMMMIPSRKLQAINNKTGTNLKYDIYQAREDKFDCM